ncbi:MULTISPECIES: antitermination protein Q [Pantoea]|uniref:Antitermination protein n=1 Tax=Candidatus Pantoea floridensis TaxID=1938870 RepID=A0A286BZZ5_9GAMM|nr:MULTISPECIES: antitermination protein [Pantoea]PIF22213.1 antitermination protein [Enterobacteriaceae bacterium JKS000233]PXW18503.1 antitermination protein [Pantoea sp. JKS000250]SOD39720.1 Antitermination protein [Pantoea floridensis]
MNLEKTVRFHFPKSSPISPVSPSTDENTLRTPEVMAALGFAQAEAGFGMSAFFGKMGISQNDKNRAVTFLMKMTRSRLMKVRMTLDLSGRQRARMIYLISLFAYEDYTRSAASPEHRCKSCNGRGFIRDVEQIAATGQRVMKKCSRCNGLGFKRVKASALFKALKAIIPELSQPTFSRHIKPIFEELIQVCFSEENRANNALKKVSHQKSY